MVTAILKKNSKISKEFQLYSSSFLCRVLTLYLKCFKLLFSMKHPLRSLFHKVAVLGKKLSADNGIQEDEGGSPMGT